MMVKNCLMAPRSRNTWAVRRKERSVMQSQEPVWGMVFQPPDVKYVKQWIWILFISVQGLPSWYSGKESACQCRSWKRHRFIPWVEKIPWSWKWQPTPVFLPGESHGQRSLVGYIPWGHKELDMTEYAYTKEYGFIKTVSMSNSFYMKKTR